MCTGVVDNLKVMRGRRNLSRTNQKQKGWRKIPYQKNGDEVLRRKINYFQTKNQNPTVFEPK